jgi:hypothetical protein
LSHGHGIVSLQVKRAGTLQGPVHFAWEWAPCAVWPVQGEDNYRGPWNNPTPNPILLVNQTHDPNSGYGNALAAEQGARQLGSAHPGWLRPPVVPEPEHVRGQGVCRVPGNLVTPPPGTVCQSNQLPFDPNFITR